MYLIYHYKYGSYIIFSMNKPTKIEYIATCGFCGVWNTPIDLLSFIISSISATQVLRNI